MKKHLQVIFVLIIYCLLFCSDDVFAFGSEFYLIQEYNGSSFIGNYSPSQRELNYTTYNLNGNSVANNINILWNNSTAILGTGYNLAVFNGVIEFSDRYNLPSIININAFGDACYYNTKNESGLNGTDIVYRVSFTAYCPTSVPSNINQYVEMGTISFKESVPTRLFMGNYSVIKDNVGGGSGGGSCVQCDFTNLENYMITNNNLLNSINSKIQDITGYSYDTTNAINNLATQQQQQNQIINNTNTSDNATNFSNTITNNTLPNNSHAFDILSGLQGLINGLQPSGSCSRISVPIPFTNQTLILPCMTTDVYSVHFPAIVVLWQLLLRGISYYYILVNILRLVKETIDPFNFKLEVMDL